MSTTSSPGPSKAAAWGAALVAQLIVSVLVVAALIIMAIVVGVQISTSGIDGSLMVLVVPSFVIALSAFALSGWMLQLMLRLIADREVPYLRALVALVAASIISFFAVLVELLVTFGATGGALTYFLLMPALTAWIAGKGRVA